jgi:23S rRNA (guanosine2251-2'-O)-methyltransferase
MRQRRTTEPALVVTGANPVLELLRSGAPVERVVIGPGPRRTELMSETRRRGVPCVEGDRATLDRLAGRAGHQGTVAYAPPFRYRALEDIDAASVRCILVLDGIQDPRNLGAILRTARAAGVGGVVLPQDRSCGITSVVVGASAGTLFGLRIARVPNLVQAMKRLKAVGFWLTGLVPAATRSLFELTELDRIALVVGGEGDGLRALVRRTCDFEVRIPMAAGVESLNVSVAAGVALFELCRKAGQLP